MSRSPAGSRPGLVAWTPVTAWARHVDITDDQVRPEPGDRLGRRLPTVAENRWWPLAVYVVAVLTLGWFAPATEAHQGIIASMTSNASKGSQSWRTVGFQPAPPGWRVVFRVDETGPEVARCMPGWLVQDEYFVDKAGQLVSGPPPAHRVVAGASDDDHHACIIPVDEHNLASSGNFKVFAPGEETDREKGA